MNNIIWFNVTEIVSDDDGRLMFSRASQLLDQFFFRRDI